MSPVQELTDFVWNIAESLRGRFGRHEHGNIMLPFMVMRRLDCAFASHREAIWTRLAPPWVPVSRCSLTSGRKLR
jgi:type I restriction-modification system DNA methylase subunit